MFRNVLGRPNSGRSKQKIYQNYVYPIIINKNLQFGRIHFGLGLGGRRNDVLLIELVGVAV